MRMNEAISTTAVGPSLSLPWRSTDRNTSGSSGQPTPTPTYGGEDGSGRGKGLAILSPIVNSNSFTPPSQNCYHFRPYTNPPPQLRSNCRRDRVNNPYRTDQRSRDHTVPGPMLGCKYEQGYICKFFSIIKSVNLALWLKEG